MGGACVCVVLAAVVAAAATLYGFVYAIVCSVD